MSIDESRARAALETARAEAASGNTVQAIQKLSELYGRKLDSVTLECLDFFVELCLCSGDGQYVDQLDLSKIRGRLRHVDQADTRTEMVVEMVMKHFRTMLSQANAKIEEMISTPSEEDVILAALSGVPLPIRAKERYMDPCVRAALRIAREFFQKGLIGVSKKVIRVFNSVAIEFTTYMKEIRMKHGIEVTSNAVCIALNNLLFSSRSGYEKTEEMKAACKDFHSSETSGEDTVKMLCFLLDLATEQRLWPQVLNIIEVLKKISDFLYEERGAREIKSLAYRHMADTFWTFKNYGYHAYCLSAAVAAEEEKTLSTRALLAVLCCADVNEEENPFSRRNNNQILPEIAEHFNDPNTSKASMLGRLKLMKGFLSAVDPAAVALLTALEDSPENGDFRTVHTSLSRLMAQHVSLRQYEPLLRLVILRHQLKHLATESHVISISSLNLSDSGTVSEAQYLHVVEPAILSASGVPVEIDSKLQTISFRSSAQLKIFESFKQLSAKIDDRPRAPQVIFHEKTNNASASIPVVTLEQLNDAHTRAITVHALQSQCVEFASKRLKDREHAIEMIALNKIKERRDNEERARERLQEIKHSKALAAYRERQRQERGKLVLAKLRSRYPGFKVDDSITLKSASAFEDELTQLLAGFKRKSHVGDRDDVLRGNLFDRTLRRLEIPKRKEFDQHNAEQNRIDREAARRNNLAQHRKEFEKRQEEKATLKKFLAAAEAFDQQWKRTTAKGTTTKRDEQLSLLEQERARLASQQ